MADLRGQCERLWAAFRAGDEIAFQELYDLTYPALFRYGVNLFGDRERVRDAMQEAYVGLWRRRPESTTVEQPWVFLLVSVRNQLIDSFRRESNAPPPVPLSAPSAETELIDEERHAQRRRWIRSHLDQLPQRQREALHLRYLSELDYPDIARIMDVTRQVAYNYVNRGLLTLRRTLGQYPEGLLGLAVWWLFG